ncbi:hypothetical protein Bbelb_206570 [Branchiostoma belcheri]|nr:hypothetical protein Bbelb_206570 [Branchiostoma belcheri]
MSVDLSVLTTRVTVARTLTHSESSTDRQLEPCALSRLDLNLEGLPLQVAVGSSELQSFSQALPLPIALRKPYVLQVLKAFLILSETASLRSDDGLPREAISSAVLTDKESRQRKSLGFTAPLVYKEVKKHHPPPPANVNGIRADCLLRCITQPLLIYHQWKAPIPGAAYGGEHRAHRGKAQGGPSGVAEDYQEQAPSSSRRKPASERFQNSPIVHMTYLLNRQSP